MTTPNIIAEFGTKEPEESFYIEYRDSEGHWENAVGTWDNKTYKVESTYDNKDVAVKLAKVLHNIIDTPFRVVQDG